LIWGSYAKHWLQSEPWPSDIPSKRRFGASAAALIGLMTDVLLVEMVLEFMVESEFSDLRKFDEEGV